MRSSRNLYIANLLPPCNFMLMYTVFNVSMLFANSSSRILDDLRTVEVLPIPAAPITCKTLRGNLSASWVHQKTHVLFAESGLGDAVALLVCNVVTILICS